MTQAIVGGLTSGAIYALLGLGIVIVYGVSRFVNLAQGEYYVYGALLSTTLVAADVPIWISALLAIGAVAIMSAALERIVFSRLVDAPHAAQLLAGIGVAFALAGAARVFWGTQERTLPAFWDRDPIEVLGARISMQVLALLATLCLLWLLLWLLLHRTMLGTMMRAVATLSGRAGLLSVNVTMVTTVAFALAGAAGAAAGIVVTPLVFVTYHSGLLLTIYGFIAAAFGGMRSIRGTVAGGLLIGVLESLMAYYGDSALKTPMAFVLLVLILVYRASRESDSAGLLSAVRSARTRAQSMAALPPVAPPAMLLRLTGLRANAIGVGLVALFAVAGPVVLSPYWVSLLSFVGVFVIVGIGLDLLLGYTGQLSLGQTAFMGVSAYMVALSSEWWGLSAWPAALIAVAFTVSLAAGLGAVVLRLRNYYFTLATLAIAIAAEALVSGLPAQLGGPSGLRVRTTLSLPGFVLDTSSRLFTATWITVCVALVVALRLTRSRVGLAMKAVGADEALASAAAITPFTTKLKIFIVSGVFAGVAGVLYAHTLMYVSPSSLGLLGGFDAVVGLLLGGFGTVWGAVVGIPIIRLAPQFIERFAEYQELIYGLLVVSLVVLLPDGLVGASSKAYGRVRRGTSAPSDVADTGRATAAVSHAGPSDREAPVRKSASNGQVVSLEAGEAAQTTGPALRADGVSKKFGGIRALSDVHLAVSPGRIVGLIGPNGAGKSTFLSALAGSLQPDSGQVTMSGQDITGFSADARARYGLARTFQLPRIPHQMTVLDVAMLGTYRRGHVGVFRSVLGATSGEQRAMEAAAMEALELTGIAHLRHLEADRLSTGEQKMLELARALASAPQVLLADEPAGGLFDDEVARLEELLRKLASQGLSIVLVEHHMELVMSACSEIVVLNEGHVIAIGAPKVVRSNQEVLDAYLGV
ncbi:MAG: hypothetical protein CL424_06825 [Acidimicrobiaceae bacterium]|nr:hypothetical protein [Acidimicrobiaceae bacterium]